MYIVTVIPASFELDAQFVYVFEHEAAAAKFRAGVVARSAFDLDIKTHFVEQVFDDSQVDWAIDSLFEGQE